MGFWGKEVKPTLPAFIEQDADEVYTYTYNKLWDDEKLPEYIKSTMETEIDWKHSRKALNLIYEVLSTKEVTKDKGTHSEITLIEMQIRCLYSYRTYTGERHGNQLVHAVPFTGAYPEYSQYADGYTYVNTFLPEAVHRVGCNCCYGNGPDINAEMDIKTRMLNFYVDFEFSIPED